MFDNIATNGSFQNFGVFITPGQPITTNYPSDDYTPVIIRINGSKTYSYPDEDLKTQSADIPELVPSLP